MVLNNSKDNWYSSSIIYFCKRTFAQDLLTLYQNNFETLGNKVSFVITSLKFFMSLTVNFGRKKVFCSINTFVESNWLLASIPTYNVYHTIVFFSPYNIVLLILSSQHSYATFDIFLHFYTGNLLIAIRKTQDKISLW